MKFRHLLAPLGVAAVLACALAPVTSASASTAHAPAASRSDTLFVQTANGDSSESGLFFAGDGPVDFFITGGTPGHLRLREATSGATVCEADSLSTGRGRYHCITKSAFEYGVTSLIAEVIAPDGHVDAGAIGGARVIRYFEGSTIQLDHVDTEALSATVSGVSLPRSEYTVQTRAPFATEYEDAAHGTVRDDGTWSEELTHVAPSTAIRFALDVNDGFAAARVQLPAAAPVPSPVVSSVEKNGNGYTVVVKGPEKAGVYIYSGGSAVAYSRIPAAGTVSLWFTDPKVEREFTVKLQYLGEDSESVPLRVNEGVGSPTLEAPTVSDAQIANSRLTAVVDAAPGAVVRVNDASGTTVAVKVAGRSGSAQVVIPLATTRAVTSYSVTQTEAGVTSAPTTIPPVD